MGNSGSSGKTRRDHTGSVPRMRWDPAVWLRSRAGDLSGEEADMMRACAADIDRLRTRVVVLEDELATSRLTSWRRL